MAKATKNKKNKEGRHVGLDIYDLLIEARFDDECNGIFQQLQAITHRESARVSVKGQNVISVCYTAPMHRFEQMEKAEGVNPLGPLEILL